jgi:hypothetical protein
LFPSVFVDHCVTGLDIRRGDPLPKTHRLYRSPGAIAGGVTGVNGTERQKPQREEQEEVCDVTQHVKHQSEKKR